MDMIAQRQRQFRITLRSKCLKNCFMPTTKRVFVTNLLMERKTYFVILKGMVLRWMRE